MMTRVSPVAWVEPAWPPEAERICGVQRVVAGERVRLAGLRHGRIDAEELVGVRIVVAVYSERPWQMGRAIVCKYSIGG